MPGVIATRSTRWRRLPALGTSWPPGSAPSARQRTGTPLRDPAGLLGEEGAGFYQDLPLLLEDPDPPAQAGELLALLGGEPLFAAGVDVGLAGPGPERLDRYAEVAGHSGEGPSISDQSDRFSSKLRRVGRSRPASHADSLPGKTPKPEGLHESGSTPLDVQTCSSRSSEYPWCPMLVTEAGVRCGCPMRWPA